MSDEWQISKGEDMGKIERFEDFIAWQKARALATQVYKLTGQGRLARDFGLRDQMQRAAVSTMSNIAEGFERGRPSEFHQFLSVAKASCGELRSQLYVALDVDYVDSNSFQNVMASAEEVGRLVGGLRASVERRRS
jgi:four helix bundle protein